MIEKLNKLEALLTVEDMAKALNIKESEVYKFICENNIHIFRLAPNTLRVPKYELIECIKKSPIKSINIKN